MRLVSSTARGEMVDRDREEEVRLDHEVVLVA